MKSLSKEGDELRAGVNFWSVMVVALGVVYALTSLTTVSLFIRFCGVVIGGYENSVFVHFVACLKVKIFVNNV